MKCIFGKQRTVVAFTKYIQVDSNELEFVKCVNYYTHMLGFLFLIEYQLMNDENKLLFLINLAFTILFKKEKIYIRSNVFVKSVDITKVQKN